MKPIPDQAARAQALDPHRSFIVQAPAGAGKTELLTQRYLTLLSVVPEPEQVVALTFTRKAADEMKQRVLEALKAALEASPPEQVTLKTWELSQAVLAHDRHCGWNLATSSYRLKIQTFDSLAAHLAQQLPITSGLGGAVQILEDPIPIYQATVNTLLDQIGQSSPWQEASLRLLLHLDNQFSRLETLLVHLLSKRDQWLRHLLSPSSSDALRAMLDHHVKNLLKDHHQSCYELLRPHFSDLLMILNYIHAPANPFDEMQLEDPAFWKTHISTLLLTKSGQWRKTLTIREGFTSNSEQDKSIKKTALTLLKQLLEGRASPHTLYRLQFIPHTPYSNAEWQILEDLTLLLPALVAHLHVSFAQSGQVDFIEINLRALQALGSEDKPTDLALYLDYQLQHLLIDEFQDTSWVQWRLLNRLTTGWQKQEGRTLFLVGDPMQSIYRFRQAEVGLFLYAQQFGLGNIELTSLELSMNFRSAPKIIDWINHTFHAVFPSYEDIETGAIPFTPSLPGISPSSEAICLPLLSVDQPSDVLTLIAQLRKCYPQDSIAILGRSRTQLNPFCTLLSQANIPFQAVEINRLGNRPVIQDLYSLTRALLSPNDRIAWLSVLRSPLVGLLLPDLLAFSENIGKAACWPFPDLSALSLNGQQRLHYTASVLKKAFSERQRRPLALWIEGVWHALHGPETLRSASDQAESETYFTLLNTITWKESISLAQLERQIERLFASTGETNSQLQVMTIHKAKGLEFDHVILPRLERPTPADSHSLLLWLERLRIGKPAELLLATLTPTGEKASGLYDYLRQEEQIKQEHEQARLLYVAATRAKKSLHLLATREENRSFHPNSFAALLVEHFQAHAGQLSLPLLPPKNVFNSGVMRLKDNYFSHSSTPGES